MQPFHTSPMMLAQFVAKFVAEHHYATTGANLAVSFSGAQAGDFAIIFAAANTGITGLSAWTAVSQYTWGAMRTDTYCKVLTSSDISAGSVTITGTGGGGLLTCVIYRGPTAMSLKNSAMGSGTTLVITGFTKSTAARVVVTMVGNYPAGLNTSITPPSGSTQIVASYGSTVVSGSVASWVPAGNYADSASLTWGGLVAGTNAAGGQVFELT